MKPIFRLPLTYGLVGGVLGAALAIGLFYVGPHPVLVDYYLDFRVFLFGVFIFFILKEIRDSWQNGTLYSSQALLASFVFTVTFAFVASLLLFFFSQLVPGFVTSYISESEEMFRKIPSEIVEKIGKTEYDRNFARLKSTNGFGVAIVYFQQCFAISAFVSIILSVILRKQPKQ